MMCEINFFVVLAFAIYCCPIPQVQAYPDTIDSDSEFGILPRDPCKAPCSGSIVELVNANINLNVRCLGTPRDLLGPCLLAVCDTGLSLTGIALDVKLIISPLDKGVNILLARDTSKCLTIIQLRDPITSIIISAHLEVRALVEGDQSQILLLVETELGLVIRGINDKPTDCYAPQIINGLNVAIARVTLDTNNPQHCFNTNAIG